MSVLVAGTVALDSIKTPTDSRDRVLGGSATYASLAVAHSVNGSGTPVFLCGVVGDDFPDAHLQLFRDRAIDTANLDIVPDGKTFFWAGEYFGDLNTRETLETQINVLDQFDPELSAGARSASIVVLANMGPEDQLKVLAQVEAPKFVLADTMDLWINIAREKLGEVLTKLDLLVLNDSEAKMMMDTSNLITAGHRLLELGPKHVAIKKGEHGAILFGPDRYFTTGAFPLHEVADPTGAGDTFLGGVAGSLAAVGGEIAFEDIVRAIVQGTVLASFTCETFSTEALIALTP
ncbi:PfkB family carbohydrate kinase [soil metagenome]